MANINRVILTGNLTRDPELRATSGGTSVCNLRIASNARRRTAAGDWEEKPNFFDVTVWGAQGENCARFLSKGRQVAIDGRLNWREFEDRSGQRRQAVDIIADSVQFLGSRDEAGSGNGFAAPRPDVTGGSDVPIDAQDFRSAPAPAVPADDDIPF